MASKRVVNDESKIVSLVNIDINWSPSSKSLISFGKDLKLHVVEKRQDLSSIFGGIQLAEIKFALPVVAKIDLRNVKTIATNNSLLSNDVMFALGYASGKITLNSFESNSSSLTGKEFTPKAPRPCNTLDFNPLDNNLLASGFDKSRNDSSVMVWDLAHTGISSSTVSTSSGTYFDLNKPLYEFGNGELVHSLKWYQNNCVICGMNNKAIKIFDLRDLNKPKSGSFTKAVNGIVLDPHFDYRLASFTENFINVWDTRRFDNPLTQIGPEKSNIVKLEWCPTRANILAALLKDSDDIKLYEYKDYKNLNDVPEPSILSREITPFEISNPQIISSFSWHPTNESQMTVISSYGTIRDFKVIDRITLNWSPISEIIWTQGKKILQCIDSRDIVYENIDDIAVRMRKLALDGYGLSSNKLWQMFPKCSSLYYLWKWITIRNATNQSDFKLPASIGLNNFEDVFGVHNPERLNGVMGVLFNESRTQLLHPSELVTNTSKFLYKRQIYTSPSRAKALQHCGWSNRSRLVNYDLDQSEIAANTFDDYMPCIQFSKTNEQEGNYSRVAAVWIFNGKISEAIECLKRASDLVTGNDSNCSTSLHAIALALSGFMSSFNQIDSSEQSLWFEMCKKLIPKLNDPYIKAIFTFISMKYFTDSAYTEIINDKGLDIADRVAFACMYLSDSALMQFLLQLKKSLLEHVDLSAILLTGITEEGLELFSKYVENTCDVQSISLVFLWSLPNLLSKHYLVKNWVENYKQLLDCWRLWNIRAQFDIKWYANLNHLEEPRQRIYATCNYCRLPIAYYTSKDSSMKTKQLTYQQQMSQHQYNRASATNSSSNKYRTCSCANCSKTLPRCSLCLTQMGTPAGIYWRPGLNFSKTDRKLSPFSSWFTWCQTCRHGGHAAHILDWFAENVLCPVAGCKCKCMSMDANARQIGTAVNI